MKLWLLKPAKRGVKRDVFGAVVEYLPHWTDAFDIVVGCVVRADTEQQARLIAAAKPGCEGAKTWLCRSKTTCTEITADGEPGVILCDVKNG